MDLVQLLPDKFRPLRPFEALLLGHLETSEIDDDAKQSANQLREQVRELAELHKRCMKPEELISRSVSDSARIQSSLQKIEKLKNVAQVSKNTELEQSVSLQCEEKIKQL